MSRLIGISGKPGSTKQYYASALRKDLKYHGYSVESCSLADGLYRELNAFIDDYHRGTPRHEMLQKHLLTNEQYDYLGELVKEEKLGRKYDYGYSRRNDFMRKALNYFGTTIRREQDEMYWMKKMRGELPVSDFSIFIDLRFPNEADFLWQNNGLPLRIDYTPLPVPGDYKYEAGLLDVAETALDDYGDFFATMKPHGFESAPLTLAVLDYYELPAKEEKYHGKSSSSTF